MASASAIQTLSLLDPNSDDATATATAKREKIGSGPSMKESDSCSEVDLVSPERQVLPPNAGGDVGDPPEEIKQSERYTNGNPRTLPKLFSLFDAIYTPSAAEPDFGVPDADAVPVIKPRPAREMVVPGGPIRPSSTYRNPTKTVRSGPDRPQQPGSSVKTFNLFSDYSRRPSVDRGTEQAPKRRKITSVSGSPGESSDDILYEQTRDNQASSRPPKTVASGIPPLERKHPQPMYDVPEFKKIEAIMSVSKRRRRPSGQPSSTQSSREGTIVVDDVDDIQDSGPEVTKPPEPYKGTANRFPARTREDMDTRNNVRRRAAESSTSRHFPVPSTKSNISGLSRANQGNLDRANGSGQAGVQNGRHRGSAESISDDELSLDKPEPVSKKTNTGTVMSRFVKSPTSGSITREGDIRSSLPRPNQLKKIGRPGKSSSGEYPRFPVTYLRAVRELFTRVDGEEPYYLQYNPRTSQMELTTDDPNHPVENKYPNFAFNPTSVTKIIYSDENGKMVLWVTEVNTTTGNLPKLLVQVNNGALYNFLKFLQEKGDANVHELNGDKLDRLFTQFSRKFEEFHRRIEADDLELMKQRRNHRHQASDAGLTSDGKRPGNFDSSMEPPRTKKLHERLRNGSSDNETSKLERNSIEPKRSIEGSKESGDERKWPQFGRNGNDNDNRPTTRSTRGQNREIHIRSPSPQRFTNEHWDWKKYWAGGDEPLIFPLGGTNKALVDMRDIERLDEGEYLNDNLIAFYLRYLQEKSERDHPDVSKRVLFMNTFFYPRLTKGKGRKNIDYDAVKRWTSKVNVFNYDYIVVPVNENQHWYVAIICNTPKLLLPPEDRIPKEEEQAHEKEVVDLGDAGDTIDPAQPASKHKEGSLTSEVARKVSRLSIDDRGSPEPQPNGANHIDVERINPGTPNHMSTADDDTDRPQKATSSAAKGRKGKRKSIPPVRKYNTEEPRIITLDSLGLSHSPTCSNLRDFLIAEAKEKLSVDITLAQPSIGMTAKNIPEQNNYWDCGLFLLGYIEGFLDHPDETIHGIMQGRTDMASSFPKMNASDMRASMRDLIFKLRTEQCKEEHAAKISKKAAKGAGKVKEEQPTGESKNVSSASTSPKPPVLPKPEAKAAEEPAPVGETKEVLKPCEEVVNVIEEEQPKKESPSTPEESGTLVSFLDDLAGYESNTANDEKATEPSPPDTTPPPETVPEKADHREIRAKAQTPPRSTRATSSQKTSPAPSAFKLKIKGQPPKFPSPDRDRNRQRKDAGEANVVVPPSTPPPRPPQPQLRSSPRNNQIDISSGSSEDSLRVGMSPIFQKRKGAPRNVDEIPDSQGEDAERGARQDVGRSKSVDLTETTPRTRAGEAALKRQKDTTEVQKKKKSGAGGVFGGTREKGKKKDTTVVLE
ncbi:hypothetical protein V502_10992 [Pseudogymnoascus sp. VKM F-4520 (FW-2644)]|nr:hypothetical protein V502_10992 [Pseudogymnoascus sp. VKM F-4520 (FW-2644)]